MQFPTAQDKSERAWLNAEVICEEGNCTDVATMADDEGNPRCDWHARTVESRTEALQAAKPGDPCPRCDDRDCQGHTAAASNVTYVWNSRQGRFRHAAPEDFADARK